MTIRQFLDAILSVIGATSLTTEEYQSINLTQVDSGVFNLAAYDGLLGVIDSRELVSNTRDRLRYYFLARGLEVPALTAQGSSNIYIGSAL